ncbi:MAG: laccase domain-containing protein, partial [Deltaproteobacteria bacterium]|nr:laccase domain-containing protein [Deltaproteobacteria bacterium]
KSKILSKFPEIIHGFTTRELGADDTRIADELKIPVSSIVTVKQVHSNQVLFLSDRSDRSIEADAIITNQKEIFIAIRTADCVPILVYDPEHRAVGAIHAGWRGLVSGVIENAVCEMAVHFGTKPPKLLAALGPALCPGCFAVRR